MRERKKLLKNNFDNQKLNRHDRPKYTFTHTHTNTLRNLNNSPANRRERKKRMRENQIKFWIYKVWWRVNTHDDSDNESMNHIFRLFFLLFCLPYARVTFSLELKLKINEWYWTASAFACVCVYSENFQHWNDIFCLHVKSTDCSNYKQKIFFHS